MGRFRGTDLVIRRYRLAGSILPASRLAPLREPFALQEFLTQRRQGAKRIADFEEQPAQASPRAVRERGAREEKDLDVGAPLWVPRPILIVEKKVFGLGERHSEPRRRGTTPASGERGEVSPEYVAPVSRPACRSGWPDSAPQSTVLPSSARVSREHARSTAGKAGAQELMPLARRGPRTTHDEP